MERKKKWEENGRSRSEKSELRSSAPHLRGEWWENELRTRRDDSKEWFRNWGRDTRDAERGTGRMVGFLRDDIRFMTFSSFFGLQLLLTLFLFHSQTECESESSWDKRV